MYTIIFLALMLLSGLCWTGVYLLLIRKGFVDKTHGMPLFALALNIAWEGIYAYVALVDHEGMLVQGWVNLVWFLFDAVIVFMYFKYGKRALKQSEQKYFVPWSTLAILSSFVIQFAILYQLGFHDAVRYSAFLQNVLMSVMFIYMLYQRKSSKGQSMAIAVLKWIGTVAPTISMGIMDGNFLVLVLGIFCSIFDIIYIVYLHKVIKTEKIADQKNHDVLKKART